MAKFKRVGVAMPAQDVKRARQFYEHQLGLEPAMEQPDGGAMYVINGTGFFVFKSAGQASGTHTQMGMDVEDVEDAVRELKSRGVRFEEYDYPGLKTQHGVATLPDGSKSAWFKDTEGNLIALGSM